MAVLVLGLTSAFAARIAHVNAILAVFGRLLYKEHFASVDVCILLLFGMCLEMLHRNVTQLEQPKTRLHHHNCKLGDCDQRPSNICLTGI
jgi:hypothetical protein